ncbi:MAG: cell envelope integrity protein CreD [Mangrovibacterium sp.]
MKTQEFIEQKVKSQGFRMSVKLVAIGIIVLLLLIPKFMIMDLIRERQYTASEAQLQVANSWSNSQTVRGPMLTIPYIVKVTDKDGKVVQEVINEYHLLPKTLEINGELFPKKLKRSIYTSVVYESNLRLSGSFEKPDFAALNIQTEQILWEQAKLELAVSDLRGISSVVELKWNEQRIPFSPGMQNPILGDNGISVHLGDSAIEAMPSQFTIDLDLKGSNSISFTPVGETTGVHLKSTWPDPGFQGQFLPTDRKIDQNGFTADWKVLNYNRDFPQSWTNTAYTITTSDFGVDLIDVADHYQKNERSAKYGIMIILLIFLSFFLNEILTKQRVHPFQYILVGFSVLIFYLLLLSFSEHIGFNPAYLVASVSVIVLVLIYSRSFLKTWANSLALAAILCLSFLFIFILLQLESYALLVGSIGLFIMLSITMYFTRKINWYE